MSAVRQVPVGALVGIALALGLAFLIARGDEPTTAPTTAPALIVSADVQKALDDLDAAYGSLTSLNLAGTIVEDMEAAGRTQNDTVSFTSSFLAPNFFRHEIEGNLVCGSTGKQAYSFLSKKGIYTSTDAPGSRVAAADLPKPLDELLDPSLKLAMSKRPSADLLAAASVISMGSQTTIDGVSCQALVLTFTDQSVNTFFINQQTHLIRRVTMDMSPLLKAQGVPAIKTAALTVDYMRSARNGAMKAEQFAWKAPAGARDVTAHQSIDQGSEPAEQLVAHAAPSFKLPGINGKEVSLADLKGSVAVLDFWATWCPPCRASLPHLDEFYGKFKPAGVIVYAIDLQEDKDTVQKFVTDTKLTVPVLLDGDGKTAESYRASGIPETVVIGKDGKIRKVIIGFSDTTPDDLRTAVEVALKE